MASKFDRFFDASFGGNEEHDEIPKALARFIFAVLQAFCRLAFRFEVVNQEVIRRFDGKRQGAVVVAPHVSYLDAVIMVLSTRPARWIRLMAKSDLFDIAGGLFGQLIARVGAFPITRDSADRTSIKRAARMLKNGELVGLFPEGTRRGKGTAEIALHGGAALIARMGKAPIIPLGLCNLDKVKPNGKFFGFPKIKAVFGEPYALSSFDFLPKDERLDGCAWFVMRESFALSRGCTPEEVDMSALFPDAKDYAVTFAEHPIAPVDVASLPDFEPAA